ncbi:helix-turn-helix domain-containing protein [Clostridium oryzae]|uniref:Carbohydrate diacid regulator n=1 Tax=Clostridium oryzae TaxID=1450648 RepID=A0A1V4IC75_9CLOT|nr:helix-turn-helix domain-containing protein [Clostridium oryzae]OPJ57608.1 carbohydrate diacid regulator [Clostridium oryzae]
MYNEIAIYDTILELYKCQPSEKIENPNLALLKAMDKNEKTEYLNTLRHFFNNNQSIGATAEHMFLHRNTIKYRLNKIRGLMEDDFDNPLIRLQMHLSLIIDEITSL